MSRAHRGGPCTVSGCDRKNFGHGLCNMHYLRKRRAERGERGLTEANRRYQKERWLFLDAFKQVASCADCGTSEGYLDFDHRDPATKSFILGITSRNWHSIRDEIAKCDVRCRSCHTRRHNAERFAVQRERAMAV